MVDVFAASESVPGLAELAQQQAGILRREQLVVLAATVQQRLGRADQLQKRLPWRARFGMRLMRTHLDDIAGGAQALSEIDLVRLCRTFGLEPPRQQQLRRSSDGRRRYLDCLWELSDLSLIHI